MGKCRFPFLINAPHMVYIITVFASYSLEIAAASSSELAAAIEAAPIKLFAFVS
jgi:hypothetical protein